MSLSLISEAYLVDSGSETGCGENTDEEGNENERAIKQEVPVPEAVDVSPNILESEDNPKNTGSSARTEVIKRNDGFCKTLARTVVGVSSSVSASDKYLSRVTRPKRKRFGNWLGSYRKTQQTRDKLNTKRVRSKMTGNKVGQVDCQRLTSTSTSESGTKPDCPSAPQLSSPKRKVELFKCPFCLETISGKNELIKHLELHQAPDSQGKEVSILPSPVSRGVKKRPKDRARFQCRICPSTYTKNKALSDHMRVHQETDRAWKCPKCPSYFKTGSRLRVHENRYHNRTPGPTRLPCKICGKTFFPVDLSSHMKLHLNNGRSWNCPPCGFYFPSKSKLQAHLNLKHGGAIESKSSSTPKPSHTFKSMSNRKNQDTDNDELNRRNQIKKEKSSICHICKGSRWSKPQLEKHMLQIHRDGPNKKWKCLQCPSFFTMFSHLSIHENRIHHQKRVGPFPCPLCKQKFRQRFNLVQHVRYQHGHTQINTLLKLLQRSNSEQEGHLSPSQHAMSQLRPCKLVLTRCDPLISQFARPNLAAVKNEIIIGKSPGRNKSNFRIEGRKFKSGLISKSNDKGENPVSAKRIYTCPYCFKIFKEPSLLIRHLPVHTKLKRVEVIVLSQEEAPSNGSGMSAANAALSTNLYHCNNCNYSCKAVQVLHNHGKLHSEEGRPFPCSPCGYNFTTFKSLRIHEGNYHKGTKSLHHAAPVRK